MAKLIQQITHNVEVTIVIDEDDNLKLPDGAIRHAGEGPPHPELAAVIAAIRRGDYKGRLVLTGMLLPPEEHDNG